MIAVGLYIVWSFALLIIGNNIAAKNIREIYDFSRVSHAFADCAEANDWRAPQFRSAREITSILAPRLAKASMKDSDGDSGKADIRLKELNAIANRAVWNKALSGSRLFNDNGDPKAPWVFYLKRFNGGYLVGLCNGDTKPMSGDVLSELTGKPAP